MYKPTPLSTRTNSQQDSNIHFRFDLPDLHTAPPENSPAAGPSVNAVVYWYLVLYACVYAHVMVVVDLMIMASYLV